MPDHATHVPLAGTWSLWRTCAVRGAGLPFDWLDRLAGLTSPAGSAAAARSLLAEPAFLAALTWQNPQAVATWAATAATAGTGLSSYRSALVARYAQRYCAKNDSIGFFGPVGWGRLDPDAPAELTVAGTAGIRRTHVTYEFWAVEALARAWAADPRLQGHLPVRRLPAVWWDGEHAYRPQRPPLPLGPGARTVLAVVDREPDAPPALDELAAAAARGERGREPELRAEALALAEAGVLAIGFPLPVDDRPLVRLREQVGTVADEPLRKELLDRLDELAEARADVAAVATDPRPLAGALDAAARGFVAASGVPASRPKSSADAGRTLLYPDCRRDTDVVVGAPALDRLRRPLGLLLDSARWFTGQLAEAVHDELLDRWRSLARRGGPVALSDLHFAASDVLSGARGTAVHDVAADFRLRWAEILAAGRAAGPEVRLDGARVAPLVAALFPAGDAGWAAAVNHSPDLMLGRLPDGTPRWVLGELHLAMNTLESRFFHTLADDPAELAAAVAADMAGGRVVPCYPTGPAIDSRRYPPLAVHVPDRYAYWSYGPDPGPPPGARSIPATALRVRSTGDGLVAELPGGSRPLPVLELFGEFLSALAVNRFAVREPADRAPRLLLDDLVVARRCWLLRPSDLPAGVATQRGYRTELLAARLADLGLPRHLFVRSPLEPKPFYVDASAPLLLHNLARIWRKLPEAAVLTVEEMLPGPDELWLTDPEGRRYPTELRLIAADGRPRPVVVPDPNEASR